MTLYLHIGPSKTASTLAQILFASGDGLTGNAQGGCLYLPIGRTVGEGRGRVHHPIASALKSPGTPEAQALLAATEACLAETSPARTSLAETSLAGAAGHSVLISSEMCPTDPRAYLVLQDMARRQGHDLRVLFVCRDPVARLNSMYTQNIKAGHFDRSVEDFVTTALRWDSLRPCTMLQPRFAASGLGFDLLPYVATGMEPLYRQLCARIGLAVAAESPSEGGGYPPGRVNVGPSAAAIRLMREGSLPPIAPTVLYHILQRADRDLAQPAYFNMSLGLGQRIRAALAPELEALASRQMLLGTYQGETALQPCDENSVTNYEAYRAHVIALLRAGRERSAENATAPPPQWNNTA